jgi:hypothetical protein
MGADFSSEAGILAYLRSVPEDGAVEQDRLRGICGFPFEAAEARRVACEALSEFLRKSYGFPCELVPVVAGFLEAEQHLPALKWLIKHRNGLQSQLSKGGYIGDDAREALLALERAIDSLQSTAQHAPMKERTGQRRPRDVASLPLVSGAATAEPFDFSPLIADEAMRAILTRRWRECETCLSAGAPLSAIVMMGGLLETLILARVQRTKDKSTLFRTVSAPKGKDGKTRNLNEWTLKNYLDAAHELGWISRSAKDVGVVLRDYRNYVHPQKELSDSVALTQDDAVLIWDVAKSIASQLINLSGAA